jgi:hypothetical protein
VEVGTHPGLIAEVQLGALGAGPLPDRRKVLLLPSAHRLRVLLVGPVQRPLRGQPDPAQQLPDPLRCHLDAELLQDQLPDDLACPQREVELKLPRIAAS